MERKLRRITFKFGMEELRLFFKAFKPKSEQLEAWYSRLQQFEDSALRVAINVLTETETYAPSFAKLKEEIIKARDKLGHTHQETLKAVGSYAALSDDKFELQSGLMGDLLDLLRLPAEQRAVRAKMLKETWHNQYQELPDVINQQQAQDLIDRKDWESCLHYGIITEQPKEQETMYIPLFSTEKNKAVGGWQK